MQSLRLKQRVLEVQSKVFRRRRTSDPTSPTGHHPKLLHDQDSRTPKSLKKTPSIVSLASSKLSRKNAPKKNKEAGEGDKEEKDSKESNRKSWRMRECELEADSKTLVDQKVEHLSMSGTSPTIDNPIAPKAPTELHLHTSHLYNDHPHGHLTNSSPGSLHSPSTPLTILETTNILPAAPTSATALATPTTTASPIIPRSTLPTLASLRESQTDIPLVPTATTTPAPPAVSSCPLRRPSQPTRRQSLLPANETNLIHNLLHPDKPPLAEKEPTTEFQSGSDDHLSQSSVMVTRKIWVKRPNASPTAVLVGEGDMVDDVRDLVLKKYQNTLGKSYDAPDIHLRIIPHGSQRPRSLDHGRGHGAERILNPEETLVRIIEEYFPNGQSAEEALIIEVPQRRTPRPSPSQAQSYTYGAVDHIGMEGNDYFSVPVATGHSQGTPVAGTSSVLSQPSMAVLTTGQVPQIPGSPGRRNHGRPGMGRRMNTSSPTLHGTLGPQGPVMLMPRQSRARGGAADQSNSGQPLPAPPNQQSGSEETSQKIATPPPVRIGSPPTSAKPFNKKEKKQTPSSALHTDGAVPPIKVLIVEDNVINLRLLEAFMKRLKVRWESAMNGKIAVDKWRAGGFHLVLMDIQLPVMNGLDATKEIRRLERVNKIGSFPHTKLLDGKEEQIPDEVPEKDRLPQSILLRSPVIIVALTASSLQSDRHEAYAAGCNDFLTKPVNFIWLERKVTEWGCMQALIDFDGWKKWKDNPDNHGGHGNIDGKAGKNKRLMAKSGGGRKDKIIGEGGKQISTVG